MNAGKHSPVKYSNQIEYRITNKSRALKGKLKFSPQEELGADTSLTRSSASCRKKRGPPPRLLGTPLVKRARSRSPSSGQTHNGCTSAGDGNVVYLHTKGAKPFVASASRAPAAEHMTRTPPKSTKRIYKDKCRSIGICTDIVHMQRSLHTHVHIHIHIHKHIHVHIHIHKVSHSPSNYTRTSMFSLHFCVGFIFWGSAQPKTLVTAIFWNHHIYNGETSLRPRHSRVTATMQNTMKMPENVFFHLTSLIIHGKNRKNTKNITWDTNPLTYSKLTKIQHNFCHFLCMLTSSYLGGVIFYQEPSRGPQPLIGSPRS